MALGHATRRVPADRSENQRTGGVRDDPDRDGLSAVPCAWSLLISVASLSRLCRAATRASDVALNCSREVPAGAAAGANQPRCGDQPAIAFLAAPP